MKLGRLRGLIYTSDKGRCGLPRTYVHFMESMPLLVCDPQANNCTFWAGAIA